MDLKRKNITTDTKNNQIFVLDTGTDYPRIVYASNNEWVPRADHPEPRPDTYEELWKQNAPDEDGDVNLKFVS